jgi:thiol:disulfide interchange protein
MKIIQRSSAVKVALILIVIATMFGSINCGQAGSTQSAVNWKTDFAAAQEQAKKENKLMLITFHADWCSWCHEMDEQTFSKVEVGKASEPFVCVKVDVDEHRDIAKQFGVNPLPYTVIARPNGDIVDSKEGYLEPEELLPVLTAAAQK